MLKDYFILATRNLRKRKLRTFLTLLGIFISIATIFLLISLSLGLENLVEEQFEILGVSTGDYAKILGITTNYRGRTDVQFTKDGVQMCPYERIFIKAQNPTSEENK